MSEQRVDLEQLPPLEITRDDHDKYDAEWESRWDGYPVDAIVAQLNCRERQLTAAKAENAKQAEQIREAREMLKLIEHKADQRLQGQYTEVQILGIILKQAREVLLKLDSGLSQTAPPKDTPSEGMEEAL